jgi:hypothetical protein
MFITILWGYLIFCAIGGVFYLLWRDNSFGTRDDVKVAESKCECVGKKAVDEVKAVEQDVCKWTTALIKAEGKIVEERIIDGVKYIAITQKIVEDDCCCGCKKVCDMAKDVEQEVKADVADVEKDAKMAYKYKSGLRI